LQGPKKSKDMFVTQENLNHSFQALMNEILNLGEAMKLGFESLKTELREDMKAMEDGIRKDMKAMEQGIRKDMTAMDQGLSGRIDKLQDEVSAFRKEFQESKTYFTQEIGELKVQSQKTLAKVEEVHTISVYALDGYSILWNKARGHERRLDSIDDFISKF